ncbi:hypothetical protein O181_067465 [Austropuccinia psidii MF-1]|uniref:Uncharacterized protein n=1 Tax=Austropuccinia psidii MF-1 TaxID=1389203 RepID=A0A9Q3EZ11_9BASI|nr:hypothetical protein [Austropuccinia psidii MF-1]
MEHGQKELQISITLGRAWRKLPEDMSQRDTLQRSYGNSQRMEFQKAFQTSGGEGNQYKGNSSHYPSYRRTIEPDRAYSDSFRLTRSRPTQLSSGFTLFRYHQISGQESLLFTIPGSFQGNTRIQREKQHLFWPEAERVRPNEPESDGIGERSTQEPEIVVSTLRISSPINRNINPTQNEHNVVTPESNSKIDQLWLQISQFEVQTQKKFYELNRSHLRLKGLTTLQEATIKAIHESCSKLREAFKEINKRLNQVFEQQKHCKRDRNCMYQDKNKLFNVFQNMNPQQQGHALDNPYQEDIKPDVLSDTSPRSP